jgi:hypothetical protein
MEGVDLNAKERSIVFSTEMIRALLAGRKFQTRRLVKVAGVPWTFPLSADAIAPGMLDSCKYGKVGDRLWVREKIYCLDGNKLPKSKGDDFDNLWCHGCDYATNIEDSELDTVTKTISPIYMPRWCCRIELVLTEVSIERVGDISKQDAISEGLASEHICEDILFGLPSWGHEHYLCDPRVVFADLWNSINTKPGTRFDDNPWVWVLKFEVTK